MGKDMDVKQWYEQQFLPWKQAVADVLDNRAAQQRAWHVHVGQLQAIAALLLDGKTRQAVMAWNTLRLHPALRDMQLEQGGDVVRLVDASGTESRLRVDDVLAELERMLAERAVVD